MLAGLRHFVVDDSGQGLVEYALIIALVAVALVGALTVLKNQISSLFGRVNTQLNKLS